MQNYLLEESQTLNNILSVSTDAGNNNISNLANPIDNYDAATKAYVDVLKTEILKLKNTNVAGGGITDIEGNYYNTVTIGTQIWMAENLKTTKYNDNTTIPHVTDSVAWLSLSTPAYCWYNNDSLSYANIYGNIYNWYTVNTGKLCPVGWHVPSDAEWETLTTYLGGVSVAGGKLKETGTFYWNSPNTNATNETGFTALPAGDRHSNGGFYVIQSYGFWWTTTSVDANTAWYRYVRYNSGGVVESSTSKNFGFSVRCVKD